MSVGTHLFDYGKINSTTAELTELPIIDRHGWKKLDNFRLTLLFWLPTTNAPAHHVLNLLTQKK